MTREIPTRISQAWIDSAKNLLAITRKEIDDEPNPAYVAKLSEIEQAEAARADWDAFESWMRETEIASVNRYPVRTANGRAEAGTVFFSKSQNRIWSFDLAWSKYCEANPESEA